MTVRAEHTHFPKPSERAPFGITDRIDIRNANAPLTFSFIYWLFFCVNG
jgi:hypothetical protein